MAKEDIQFVQAREILDSNGHPTVEVTVALKDGVVAVASVPAGTTTGEHEAWELRDNDPDRYDGMGVLRAVEHVNQDIGSSLQGMDVTKQQEIDERLKQLDGTPNKTRLGANALLGVSLACARAGAMVTRKHLYEYLKKVYGFKEGTYTMPIPMFNIFNGGKHADTNLDIQEIMVVPKGIISVREQVRVGASIFHKLGRILVREGMDTDVGIQGGYAPTIESTTEAIGLILQAIDAAGQTSGAGVSLALDVGASAFYDERKHQYIFKIDESFLTTDQMISLYNEWTTLYPIMYIEDGLDQNDWVGWRQMTEELTRGRDMQVVGDALFVSNVERLSRGVSEQVGNAVVIKPNQIGTVSEAVAAVQFAQKSGYKVIASQRSGETNDDFIADFAVAVNADFIKAGSLARGERVTKYNRLMAIEQEVS